MREPLQLESVFKKYSEEGVEEIEFKVIFVSKK